MDFTGGDAARLAAVLAFDRDALGQSPASDDLGAELGRAWCALMGGAAAGLDAELAALFARASASRDPARVIEATALRAMAALSLGNLPEAVAFARRASRMARTEALPPSELLANLVLGRVRRRSGKPHLAARAVRLRHLRHPAAAQMYLIPRSSQMHRVHLARLAIRR